MRKIVENYVDSCESQQEIEKWKKSASMTPVSHHNKQT